MNEGAERLELLRIEKTTSLVFKPEKKDTPAAAPAATPATPGAAPTEAVARAPIETLYSVWCEKAVKVEQATRTLTGERLEAWVRLVGQRAPPGALANRPLNQPELRFGRRSRPRRGDDDGREPAPG